MSETEKLKDRIRKQAADAPKKLEQQRADAYQAHKAATEQAAKDRAESEQRKIADETKKRELWKRYRGGGE